MTYCLLGLMCVGGACLVLCLIKQFEKLNEEWEF